MWRAESHMAALWLSATGHQLLLLGFTIATRTFSHVASFLRLLQHALSPTACEHAADLSTECKMLNFISQLTLHQSLSSPLLCAHMQIRAHSSPHMCYSLIV